MHLMHVKMTCCILFGSVLIETGKLFFDCSNKVSFIEVRLGRSRSCGGFSGDGNVLNGARCFVSGVHNEE